MADNTGKEIAVPGSGDNSAPILSPSEAMVVQRNWDRYMYGKLKGHEQYIYDAREDEDAYLGRGLQWSEEDREYLESVGRPALEENHIFPAVNTAIGLQLQSRVDIAFRPAREGSSEKTAETLSKVGMQICDDVKFRWHETQVYSDGMIQQRGYFDFRMDFAENIQGDIACATLNPLHVIPDPDASSYDPREWADVTIVRYPTIDEIGQIFGQDKATQVFSFSGYNTMYGDDPDLDNKIGFGQDGSGIRGYESLVDEKGTSRVMVLDRQYRVFEMQQAIATPTGDVISTVGMSKQQIAYELNAGAFLAKRFLPRIRWSVTANGVCLHDNYSPYRTYTVVPYFPYFRRGRTRGMVDNALDPQRAANKLLSQIVHIVNTTANSGYFVPQGSLVNMTVDDLARRGAESGIVVVYDPTKGKPEKIQPNSLPLGHERIIDRSEYSIKSITGISDALQGLHGPEVSGEAIKTKQYMGQTQLGGPLDNLARTRHMCAEKFLELLQDFYTEERVIMVTDTTDISQIKYDPVKINEVTPEGEIINDFTVGKYSVVVTDQPTQATFQDNQFKQAMEMRKEGVNIPDSALIEMSSLTKKHEIAKKMSEATPASDPVAEAKARNIDADTQVKIAQKAKVENETANVGVDAMYSATQAAGVLATNPVLAPMADEIAKSAGLVDRNQAPMIPNIPGSSIPMQQGEMPVDMQSPSPAQALATDPSMAMNVPDSSGPDGMQAGIETPQIEGM